MLIRSENDNHDLRVFPSKESMENHLVSQIIQIIEENIYNQIINNIITNIEFTGGCPGNLLAISKLVNGMTVEEIEQTVSTQVKTIKLKKI